MCGEKKKGGSPEKSGLGSPPRMREKGGFLFHVVFQLGITPAHAGKSRAIIDGSLLMEDHPRMCGEKWMIFGHK